MSISYGYMRKLILPTFSGRILASAILWIGSADVLVANTQWAGITYKQNVETYYNLIHNI